MNHSLPLHRKIYSVYKDKGLTEERRNIVYNFTNGKTDNSSELSTNEIIQLIKSLENFVGNENKPQKRVSKTINKLFALCYDYGWKNFDVEKDKFVVDVEALNNWLLKYGKYHKKLNDHSPYELGIVTSQFEKVVNNLLKSF